MDTVELAAPVATPVTRTQPLTAEPSLYEINATDDQRLEGMASRAYDELARAIQAIDTILADGEVGSLNEKINKPLGAANRALRRAAWLTVLYHSTKDPVSPSE
jgi:hypothetical protein